MLHFHKVFLTRQCTYWVMPHFDAHLFMKKGVKKNLTLVLDEGDSVLDSVRKAMQEHNVKEVTVEEADGTLKDGVINFFERNNYGSAQLKDTRVLRVSGNFKLSYGDLYGKMNISTFDKPPLQGTLVRAKAGEGFKLVLSFVELVDGGNAGQKTA